MFPVYFLFLIHRKIAEILLLKENDDEMKKLILTDLFYYAFTYPLAIRKSRDMIFFGTFSYYELVLVFKKFQ